MVGGRMGETCLRREEWGRVRTAPGLHPAHALRLEGGKRRELSFLAGFNPGGRKKLRRQFGPEAGYNGGEGCRRSLWSAAHREIIMSRHKKPRQEKIRLPEVTRDGVLDALRKSGQPASAREIAKALGLGHRGRRDLPR